MPATWVVHGQRAAQALDDFLRGWRSQGLGGPEDLPFKVFVGLYAAQHVSAATYNPDAV